MCSNYALSISEQNFAEEYGVTYGGAIEGQEFFPYHPTNSGSPVKPYNISVAVILNADGKREVIRPRWGLLPHWSTTDQDPIQPSNAKVESVAEKPMFREPFKSRRCLVPVTSFFEYGPGETGKRPRYRFKIPTRKAFAFAGLYNVFEDLLYTMAFITSEPSEWFSEYHDRQSVLLYREEYEHWLDPKATVDELKTLLVPWQGKLYVKPAPNKK